MRELLLTECDLQAVITLPAGVFRPYSGVGTAVFIFQNGAPTEYVWFYELAADGYSLDDRRMPVEDNDIPDLLARWARRTEGPRSFRVPVADIRANDWQLLPNRYRRVQLDAIPYTPPKQIATEVLDLESEIAERARNLLDSLERR